jgi:hypothetical protein
MSLLDETRSELAEYSVLLLFVCLCSTALFERNLAAPETISAAKTAGLGAAKAAE